MITEIRHFGIVVDDLEQSLSFYKRWFGFEIYRDADENGEFIETILSVPNAHLRTVKMRSKVSDVLIELISYVSGEVVNLGNSVNRVGPTHIAFTISDIDHVYEMMKEEVSFLSKPKISPDGYAKVVFCKAPEGTYIEMVEVLG